MAKIVLSDVQGGYNLAAIKDNFDKVANELNNKVLYRNNPVGETNVILNDLDMNGKHIYNLPVPALPNEPVRLIDLQNATIEAGGGSVDWEDITGKPTTFPPSSHTHIITEVSGLNTALANKQDLLISGDNIKTVNGNSLLGSGDLVIAGGGSGANLSATLSATEVVINSDTGTDATIPAADGTNAGVMTSADQIKLAGIATGATANDTDANLKARSNHTGTQASSTISDFAEAVDDRVSSLLVAGTNVTLTYNDVANTLTIDATAGGGGSGDVVGPASATDNAVARFNTTTGKLLQNSGVIIDDNDTINIKGTKETVVVANSGSAYTVDLALGTEFEITLTADCTFTFPTPERGKAFTLTLIQNASLARIVSFPSSVRGNNNTNTFTMSTGLGRVDTVTFVAYGTTRWRMFIGQQNMNPA